jgi:hypothetical protein
MTMNTMIAPAGGDDSRHDHGGEADHHQHVGGKNDGAELTAPSVQGRPADETEPASTDKNTDPDDPVDAGDSESPKRGREDGLDGEQLNIHVPTCDVDLDSIAIDQDFAAMTAVKTGSSAPPIRKSGNQLWFCSHPDQKLWRSFPTIKDESDSDAVHVIGRSVAEELQGEWNTTLLVPCITLQQEVFFLPIKLPDSEGRIDSWNQSRLELVVANPGMWVRHRSNQFIQGYEKMTPLKQLPPPTWPDDVLGLLKKSVSKVYVGDLNHPLIKRLLGEA